MKRRAFSAAIILAAAVCLAGLSAPKASAETIKLTYANFPPAITFPCIQMERWKQEVEKRTNGQVQVQTFPGSTLLNPKNMLDGVKQGQADIGNTFMSYFPGKFPLLSVIDQPVYFTSSKVASLVLWDLWDKYRPASLGDFKVLTMFTTAPTNIMSTVPIRNLADLRGVELRAAGGPSGALKLLGAVPVSMPMSETPDALQKGLVKGLFSSLEVLKDFNFAEKCRYETLLNTQVYSAVVVMNKEKWESLPENVKQVMNDLRREQALWTGEYMDGHVAESLAWSKKKYGIKIFPLSAPDRAHMAETLMPMIQGWKKDASAAGVDANAVFGDLMSLKAKYEALYGK